MADQAVGATTSTRVLKLEKKCKALESAAATAESHLQQQIQQAKDDSQHQEVQCEELREAAAATKLQLAQQAKQHQQEIAELHSRAAPDAQVQ